MSPQTQFCNTYSMCWISDSSEIVFQLEVEFDFIMCKFFSGAFLSCFFLEERAFLMGCWLDVLLEECIRIVSSLFNTSKNWLRFLA